ncbi:hypothetical protein Q0N71_27935 [Bacillus thuringiensis]|uniref:hypothetical protein n=1 Tax=Bacillus thuringiensis TaxID=1428 RepID=UPI00345ABC4E
MFLSNRKNCECEEEQYTCFSEEIFCLLKSLDPGTSIILKLEGDCPQEATFLYCQSDAILVSDIEGFCDVVYININKINAISICSEIKCCKYCGKSNCRCYKKRK